MLNTLFLQLAFGALFLLPAAALIFDFIRERRKDNARAVDPFEELQRRPAGESLRLEVEKIGEDVDAWLVMITMAPVALATALALQPHRSLQVAAGFFFICALVTALAAGRLQPLRKRLRAYRLGFQGERYVAEELNQLIADGFQVFHDVPFDKFNLDHVLIGGRGVFVVETKTRRKKTADGDEKHRVIFDGARLNFPSSWDTDALEQARLNAKTLSQWLTSSTADRITAKAILTIPGWFVERSGKSDVYVANPKQIRPHVLAFSGDTLSREVVQRAKHQLEQKCRLSIK